MVLTAGIASGLGEELLKYRKWSSTDGNELKAMLVLCKGAEITLKRQKDRRDFTMPLDRLSADDRRFIDEIRTEVKEMIDQADDPNRSGTQFVGFTDPSETTWEVARRLDMERDLWNRPTQALWYYLGRDSMDRLIRIDPKKIERISDAEYFVHGEWISLKIRSSYGKLGISGDRLILTHEDDKYTVTERGVEYAPRLSKENLISLKTEKVGVAERLVMTIEFRDRFRDFR